MTVENWRVDSHFSKRYALLRVVEDYSGRMGIRKVSDYAHQKRNRYILNYLNRVIFPVLQKYKNRDDIGIKADNLPVWVFWWTGMDNAPQIVRQCIKSIQKSTGQHPFYFIDQSNYTEYVSIPQYIMDKLNAGNMRLAHFADYLRVYLIAKYGGLWLDATIYCADDLTEDFFEYPFFTCKSPYQECRYLSHYQWCTFCLGGWKHNLFFLFMKEAFEKYWKEEAVAIDYLFFDYLIYLAKENNVTIAKFIDTVPVNTLHRDDLQAAMNAGLPAEEFWNVIQEDTVIYKLSWREIYKKKTTSGNDTVYQYFLRMTI